MLSETAFPWKEGERIRLTVKADGNRLQALAEADAGGACAEVSFPAGLGESGPEPGPALFGNGCIGILVRDGSHVKLEQVRIRPVRRQ